MSTPTIPLAFVAGFMSFASPCVLPLVPGYLAYMSNYGVTAEQSGQRRKRMLVAFGFVAGFTMIFVILGASTSLASAFLHSHRTAFERSAGLAVITMGLVFMSAIKIPILYREARFHPRPRPGFLGSVLLGAALALGWSPCVGATLGAVLGMAAGQTGGAGQGALLLAVYSLGLGVPFVLSGVATSMVTRTAALRRHARAINIGSGLLLIMVGIALTRGELS